MLNPEPIYLELDRKREVAYTVGSAMALRENGFDARVLIERVDTDASEEVRYRVYHAAVVAWLVACLQRESRATGEALDSAWVEDQLDTEDRLMAACSAINTAVARYYGEEKKTGEANPRGRTRRQGKATR